MHVREKKTSRNVFDLVWGTYEEEKKSNVHIYDKVRNALSQFFSIAERNKSHLFACNKQQHREEQVDNRNMKSVFSLSMCVVLRFFVSLSVDE